MSTINTAAKTGFQASVAGGTDAAPPSIIETYNKHLKTHDKYAHGQYQRPSTGFDKS